jgi:hypothetical protein
MKLILDGFTDSRQLILDARFEIPDRSVAMGSPPARRFLFSAALPVAALAVPWLRAAPVDFEKEVRPILAEKCTLCHGPDEAKAGLRLTGIEPATRVLESGRRGIVPGETEHSEVLARVRTDDPEEHMPPPGKGEPLSEAEVAVIERWIAEGAVWPKHWAFTGLRQPEPPVVKDPAWGKHPVDAFVLARLEAEGIAPSPEADAVTLIRRLFYDLAGLPPAPEQVATYRAAIEADHEAGLARLADDLLASPAFGERWGRHWLDRARYADSDGYEKDNHRPDAWRYRDWVIDAINEDMPFDRFTIEQFAGDLLEKPTPDQILATAFHRQTLTNTEGGTDKEQWRVAAVMDRVETMGSVWLGLTLTCARCHTHKYDPVTQREYYSLFAYFNNGDEVNAKVPESDEAWSRHEAALAAHGETAKAIETRLAAARASLEARLGDWESRFSAVLAEAKAAKDPGLVPLKIDSFAAPKGVQFAKEADGSIVIGGDNPATAVYTVAVKLPAGRITGLRLEVLPDESLGANGPGRTKHGNFVLNRIEAAVKGTGSVLLADVAADYSQPDWDARELLQGNTASGAAGAGWAVGGATGKAHHVDLGFAEPLALAAETELTLTLTQNYGEQHTLGRFRVAALTPPTALAVPAEVRNVVGKAAAARDAKDRAVLAAHAARLDAETRPLLAESAAHAAKRPVAPLMDVRVIGERRNDRRASHVFHRGEFKQPKEAVEPATLSVLPPVQHRGPTGDRLDLARWLVGGENPLPPRVVANDLWTQLFGEGLVATPEDFGVRGDRPSHPELLDWLAAELVAKGWSRKALIRELVLTKTYRQSSDHRPDLLDRDPKNQLLARQNRFRVEAEIVRDLSLAAAGLLSTKVGGPSVFPPIPEGVADVNYNSAFKWKTSEGEDRYRRGLYTYFKRTAPHPSLITFDCPDSNVTTVRRSRSNTPLAALITLNSEPFVEAARGLARRVLTEPLSGDDAARLDLAFRLCLSREPRDAERDRLASLLESSRAWFRGRGEEAEAFAGAPLHGGLDAAEAAAWTATVRVLLNLDEFLTRG